MEEIKLIAFGFFIKIITGFDDTVTQVPVIASLTRTRIGKVAFTMGMLGAIIVAILVAVFFSSIIKDFPQYRYITAGLIILLAIGIYFDLFIHKPKKKVEKKFLKNGTISKARFIKLLFIGFIAALATVLDDIIAYLPLFTVDPSLLAFPIIGILSAAIFEILLVIFFSEKIAHIKYKEEFAAIGLVILSMLILFEVI